ncbi:MAG: hypothetical protein WBP64_18420 [Nitrososphaeraceae archaeon]
MNSILLVVFFASLLLLLPAMKVFAADPLNDERGVEVQVATLAHANKQVIS